jgi:hypothetical protein
MIQSGEQPVFRQENYLILFAKMPYATRGKYGEKTRSVGKGGITEKQSLGTRYCGWLS